MGKGSYGLCVDGMSVIAVDLYRYGYILIYRAVSDLEAVFSMHKNLFLCLHAII